MEQVILILHVLAALAIVGLIMLQQGKGADMGASFGAGASQTLFGSQGGGNALTKATALLVALFFATSFGLAVVAKNKSQAVGVIDLPAAVEVQQSGSDLPSVEGSSESEAGDMPAAEVPDAPASE